MVRGESMWTIPLFLGIAVGLSVYSAWGVVQCKQKDKEILRVISRFIDAHDEEMNKLLDLIGSIYNMRND